MSVLISVFCVLQGCTDAGLKVHVATKFYGVVPNICGSSVQYMLLVTLLACRLARWLSRFSESSCVPDWFIRSDVRISLFFVVNRFL